MVLYSRKILVAVAVIPAIILLYKIYKADRVEKEPFGLLAKLLGFGALATVGAFILEYLGSGIIDGLFAAETNAYDFVLCFCIVAVAEEGLKYLFLRLFTWNSNAFNCQFDGVVYAVFVSLGFAIAENIGYVFQYGFEVGIVRAFTAVPGHCCFGVFMGFFYSASKKYDLFGAPARSKAATVFAVLIPMFVHGLYDYVATIETDGSLALFAIVVIVMFATAVRLVKKLSWEDGYIRY